jgi:aryl-alcohol dehydrogenase-like predicted oxidoreductase
MKAQAFEVLDAFYEGGGRHIDCARSYGHAEEFCSKWLSERDKDDDVYVSSKWGYRYTADWKIDTGGQPHEVKEHTAPHFASQVQDSFAYIPSLALYQTHSATPESGAFSDEVLLALKQLKEQNGIAIGLSTSGPNQAATIELACARKDIFSMVQTTFNPLAQAAGPALMRAREAGLDVLVKEGMANGRLLQSPPSELVAVSEDIGESIDAVVLGLVLASPFRPQVLSGAVTPSQVTSNMRALSARDYFFQNEQTRVDLMMACKQDEHEYWKDRSNLAWN